MADPQQLPERLKFVEGSTEDLSPDVPYGAKLVMMCQADGTYSLEFREAMGRKILAAFNHIVPVMERARNLLLALPDCGPSRCGQCPTCRMEDALAAAERDLEGKS